MSTALFDLGGTGARVRVLDSARQLVAELDLEGYSGNRGRLGNLLRLIRAASEASDLSVIENVAGGVTGEWGAVAAIAPDLQELHSAFGVRRLIVADDAVTSYLGALGDRPGVTVAIGTGIVALSRGRNGKMSRIDGYGAMLGDNGSGWWIGREGLIAAMAAKDGRPSGSNALLMAAADQFGAEDEVSRRIVPSPRAVSLTASFAKRVAELAHLGEPVAARIFERAGAHIGDTLVTAAHATGVVRSFTYSLLGRVSDSQNLFLPSMLARISEAGLDAVAASPSGTGIDGAAALTELTAQRLSLLSPLVRHESVRL